MGVALRGSSFADGSLECSRVFFGEYCAWAVLSCVPVSEFSTN